MLGLYIGAGVVIYLLGIFGLNFLFGRYKPYDYEMGPEYGLMTTFWPLTAILAIPVGTVIGIIAGIVWVALEIREREADKQKAIIAERRRLEQINNQINDMDIFEDITQPDHTFINSGDFVG